MKREELIKELIDEIKPSHYQYDSQYYAKISSIPKLVNYIWNAAVEECAEKARMDYSTRIPDKTRYMQGCANYNYYVDRDSILSLKIEDDEK